MQSCDTSAGRLAKLLVSLEHRDCLAPRAPNIRSEEHFRPQRGRYENGGGGVDVVHPVPPRRKKADGAVEGLVFEESRDYALRCRNAEERALLNEAGL